MIGMDNINEKKMENKNKIIRIKFSNEENVALESVLKSRSVKSPHLLIRILILEEYKKEKNKILLYGKSTSYEKKSALSDQLAELRAMSNEDLTEHLSTLGYKYFVKEKVVDELAMPPRRIKFDKIVTLENGEREWIQYHFEEGDPDKKIVYTYDTMWNIERLFKELLKLKLIK